MASTPTPRNGALPSRSTSTSSNPNPSLAEQGARFLVQRAANPQPAAPPNSATDNRRIRIVLPRLLRVDHVELEKYLLADPLVGSQGAAIILGVSLELVRKWRQRGQGPEYYQFEEGGPILYSISALHAYKAAHLVNPRKKGRKS